MRKRVHRGIGLVYIYVVDGLLVDADIQGFNEDPVQHFDSLSHSWAPPKYFSLRASIV
jgi:hypothetical protein